MLLDSPQQKEKILTEFLPIAAFEGWTNNALLYAMQKAEVEAKFLPLIFENGVLDVAQFYIESYNQKAAQKIAAINNFSQHKIRDKIRLMLHARIEVEQGNQLALQRLRNFYLDYKNFTALELGARPALVGLKSCYKIADFMWQQINDQSTDFNYYTKRLTLGKIIWRSFGCMMQDQSSDLTDTKNFIDSEIDKVMKFEKRKMQVKKIFGEVFLDENGAPKSPKKLVSNLPFFRLIKFK